MDGAEDGLPLGPDEAEGADDGLLLGLKEGSLTGLSLGSMLSAEGPELGTALGTTSRLVVGPLLGT